jgi:hypothetical protein
LNHRANDGPDRRSVFLASGTDQHASDVAHIDRGRYNCDRQRRLANLQTAAYYILC